MSLTPIKNNLVEIAALAIKAVDLHRRVCNKSGKC